MRSPIVNEGIITGEQAVSKVEDDQAMVDSIRNPVQEVFPVHVPVVCVLPIK